MAKTSQNRFLFISITLGFLTLRCLIRALNYKELQNGWYDYLKKTMAALKTVI